MGNNDSELLGMAFIATRDELITITQEAHTHSWSARFGQNAIEKWVDRENVHLLVPFTKNGSGGTSGPPSYRCYLWFKQVNANQRSCVSIDVSKQQLKLLRRPTTKQFDRLIMMLVEQLPVEFLGPYQQPV
jgi:hypothetical protein